MKKPSQGGPGALKRGFWRSRKSQKVPQIGKLEKNLERARMNLYNILAILIVIIPELFAVLIYSIEVSQHKATLPNEGEAWDKDIELKLSKMNIY